ncbi:MAG: septum formation family protein [Acidimicrobiia bacterium]|nr:septum formation family protein [Acidimicrobiia bacterium]
MSDDSPKDPSDDGLSEDGFSSEDLLRDAKEKFGLDDGSSGVADSLLESSMEEATDSDAATDRVPSIDEIAAEMAALRTKDTDFVAMETQDSDFGQPDAGDLRPRPEARPAAPDQRVPRSSDAEWDDLTEDHYPQSPADSLRVTLPDPGIPTGLPSERVEVDSDQVIAGLPVPPEASAKAGGLLATLWRNRWIVVVAVIGISVLGGILDQSEPISNRSAGDCFNEPSGATVSEITLIDCSNEHELEVFANISLSGDAFPGEFAMVEQAFNSCISRFESYVGEPYDTSILYLFPFTPTEQSWADGEREALCVVYEPVPGSDGDQIMSRTGSVRGSGL